MLSGSRVRRDGARRFLSRRRNGKTVYQRDKYDSRVYVDQYVSEDVGGKRDTVRQAPGSADCLGAGAARTEEGDAVYAVRPTTGTAFGAGSQPCPTAISRRR